MSLPDSLSTLETAGLIRLAQLEPEIAYLFRHVLVQEAAYASLLTADQKQLHLAVGIAMEQLYPDQLEKQAAVLAHHFEKAGEDQRAHQYFAIAGQVAMASYANQEAESQFRRALALPCCDLDRANLLENLGEALYRQSRFADALQVLWEGILIYQSQEDVSGVARLYARSGRIAWLNGDTPESLRLCREGLEAVPSTPDNPDLARLMHETARACLFNGLPDEALQYCRKALDMAERLSAVDVQADTLATLGVLPDLAPEEVLASLTKAVELSERNELLRIAYRAHHNLGVMISGLQGNQRKALHHYLRAAEISDQRGVASEVLYSLTNAAEISLGLGKLTEAEEMLLKLGQLLKGIQDPAPYLLSVNKIKSRLLWMRGELNQALQLAYDCQQEARQRGDLQRLYDIDANLISANLELYQRGELRELTELESLLEEVVDIGERGLGGRVWPCSWMSILRSRQGRIDASIRWLAAAREAATAQPSFWNDMALKTAEIDLAAAQERWSEALVGAEGLSQKYAEIEDQWGRARTLENWAEIHAVRGEPADLPRAQALLREVLVMFDGMGANQHKKWVEDRLKVLGEASYNQTLAYQKDLEELTHAGKIQASFLPDELPEITGWQLAASLKPVRETSGDFYDIIPLSGERLGIVVADVADKGAAAALYMTSGRTLIHTYALEHPDQPVRVFEEANRRITQDTHQGLFITVFYGVLDPARGELVYCNAGHVPPLFVRFHQNKKILKLTRTGIPLGVVAETDWTQNTLQTAPGDVLVLYTDGVTDAQNNRGEFFGDERLLGTVQSSEKGTAQIIHDAIHKAIGAFVNSAPQFDDITLVVLKQVSDGSFNT